MGYGFCNCNLTFQPVLPGTNLFLVVSSGMRFYRRANGDGYALLVLALMHQATWSLPKLGKID